MSGLETMTKQTSPYQKRRYAAEKGGSKMTASERIRAIIKGERADRLPVIEWAPWWDQTVNNWLGQGLPAEAARSVYSLQEHFGLDKCIQTLFHARTSETPVALSHGAGIIKNEADYEKIRPTMYKEPYLPREYIDWLKKTHDDGDTIHFFTVEGFFWMPRELLGIEEHLYSFYDSPELLKRICEDHLGWLKKVVDYIGNTFKFDFMSFAEDMSYNLGPMLSKECFDEFLLPYYRAIIPGIKALDTPVFIDSDGDITAAVDWYGEAGADGMFPLERQAGVDVSVYIEKHPEMTFLGHYDKMVMHKGEAAMRAEFERLMPSARKGRLIIAVDHQTPPAVSYEDYQLFVKLFKEYACAL